MDAKHTGDSSRQCARNLNMRVCSMEVKRGDGCASKDIAGIERIYARQERHSHLEAVEHPTLTAATGCVTLQADLTGCSLSGPDHASHKSIQGLDAHPGASRLCG
jgi:hypothetical protein